MSLDSLGDFTPATRAWFESSFRAPTAAQSLAWTAISKGADTLVVAPTGSGKTLAAFLWAIDQMRRDPAPTPGEEGVQRAVRHGVAEHVGPRVLYISPLKALGVDVERNLRAPLIGIRHAASRLGLPARDIHVAVRSGDTPAADRRRLLTRPPDILITTPESLYLMLTSRARESLRAVATVIVDEVHAVCSTKRGAHLAVSLERLDELLDVPAQRIGLSATVRPVDAAARFVGGQRPVTLVRPPSDKRVEVTVVVPVPDMTDPGEPIGTADDNPSSIEPSGSLWPSVENRILDLVLDHRSTLVFVNSRRLAERLCAQLNVRASERRGEQVVIARAHHGSVSREQRLLIEDELKSGTLPAVVATSSLELGIDMGAVDLVIQVEPPPSTAAGLQRVGRAGHHVGAVSRGVVFPRHRGELLAAGLLSSRMANGDLEQTTYVLNPLDVLAQQIVAMVSVEDWSVPDLAAVIRRAAPFAGLPDSALTSVLDMLTGRYPSDDFAGLRPRLTWDRAANVLRTRPGTHRIAVTNVGTIPDRGLFGVFLADSDGGGGRRVGELDEEMVYESRVGDVFLLGSTSWRILEITADRVIVAPAPGQPGKMPFWHGDSPGRPVELGRALGKLVRELGPLNHHDADARLAQLGMDDNARTNAIAVLAEQREATGLVPDDRTIVVERFRDELGDWRIAVLTPLGSRITAPWSMAIGERLRASGLGEVTTVHSDDGMIFRIPDTPDPPQVDALVVGPDEIGPIVTAELSGSALFASRFRECAARSLLLPKRDPRRRAPLWQQRQRSAGLLAVASTFPDFPVVLEAMRECLQDVFDMPGLRELMRDISDGRVRIVSVDTVRPSPFARNLQLAYVGSFLYEGDLPLAERRAQALALDTSVLAELLGTADLRELLDQEVIDEVESELQGTSHAGPLDTERSVDLLRRVGDLTTLEASARGVAEDSLHTLLHEHRVVRVRIAGDERWVAVDDASRLRDGLGCALPLGIPHAFLEPVRDPLGDLVSRYVRTHGPFTARECAARLGIGDPAVAVALQALEARGRVTHGAFTAGTASDEWVDTDVLRRIRRRSLARLRREVEAVPAAALGRFLPSWQHVDDPLRGVDGVLATVEQLMGLPLPASALETLILPRRVADYDQRMLDELCASGDVVWTGAGALPGRDGWVVLSPADRAHDVLPDPGTPLDGDQVLTSAVLAAMPEGDAVFFRTIAARVRAGLDPELRSPTDGELADAVWQLVWHGLVTNDTLGPLRAHLSTSRRAPRSLHRARARGLRAGPMGHARGDPSGAPTRADTMGRWSVVPTPASDTDPRSVTGRTAALADGLLHRYGIVSRGVIASERVAGGFAKVYPVLRAFEDAGLCRRGYFVEGLGAAQFALPGAADRLRAAARTTEHVRRALVLAAADPANPYGAAVPWPERTTTRSESHHRPARSAGALVALVDGALAMYVERGGRSLLTWTDDADDLTAAALALADAVRAGHLGTLSVARTDGTDVHSPETSPVAAALLAGGFRQTPSGLRLRG